jgi:hypothetical protein
MVSTGCIIIEFPSGTVLIELGAADNACNNAWLEISRPGLEIFSVRLSTTLRVISQDEKAKNIRWHYAPSRTSRMKAARLTAMESYLRFF